MHRTNEPPLPGQANLNAATPGKQTFRHAIAYIPAATLKPEKPDSSAAWEKHGR